MTQHTPSLNEIRQRMTADLDYRLPAAQSRPAKSVLGVLTTVMSGAISSLYGFGQWIIEQLDPMTCSESWLQTWATHLDVPRNAATHAVGGVQFIGGTELIVAGTRLRHPDTGDIYITDQDGACGETISVTAVTAGSYGNLTTLDALQLESPISGVAMTVSIVEPFEGGAEEELLTTWRLRVTERLAERQKIGDADDYEAWAKAAHADILDAKCFGNYPALGVITIRVLGHSKQPLISDQILTDAQSKLDKTKNQGCTVMLVQVLRREVDIRIADVDEDTQEAITVDITTLLNSRAKFKAQLWPEEIERILLLYTDQYTLLEPMSKVTANEHQILTLGDIQWL